jgi:large subunit ribosomal protein L30
MAKVRITWSKSQIGCNQRQRDTLRALGLRRRGAVVIKESNPAINGMISNVNFLLEVEEIAE